MLYSELSLLSLLVHFLLWVVVCTWYCIQNAYGTDRLTTLRHWIPFSLVYWFVLSPFSLVRKINRIIPSSASEVFSLCDIALRSRYLQSRLRFFCCTASDTMIQWFVYLASPASRHAGHVIEIGCARCIPGTMQTRHAVDYFLDLSSRMNASFSCVPRDLW